MSAPVAQNKDQLIVNVVEMLELNGGRVPDNETGFWRELASHLGLVPKSKDASRVAHRRRNEVSPLLRIRPPARPANGGPTRARFRRLPAPQER